VAVVIREESVAGIAEYARVPIAFSVEVVLEVTAEPQGRGDFEFRKRNLAAPYLKDYDTIDGGPVTWAQRFDLSKWGFFSACLDDSRVGGAAVAFGDPAISMLEGREDLAVLWDIRVSPEHRERGIGSALLASVIAWACVRRCRTLKVETQNVNAGACAFYARHGFVLRAANPLAYPALPDEVQLLWYKDLSS